ncbi:MAG: carboxypeptidase-like regulatory domain-containing protein [Bacteroidales bacterium]|jgi:hypothetical protein|nr:carboxypeptidase-like regulatory domain-containing protein [Bacteroidales bacterium]MDD2612201.1 carboxypeptidase-like regulatory domain-containing protein [Bacteroidales bacterium]MDD3907075.1 carboxypeptidase-like regulatory domain-containing protein [Bacteroidales bacterium]MDD4713168.1 carboxypeptidase-like regulatory domain-containing protein [Bacteroidales bacterium]MEA4840776.1 carboxypeptidase-like regulatory domain-containing protein [Bacteroidales bacterium]
MKNIHLFIFTFFILILQACSLNEFNDPASMYGTISNSQDQPISGVKIEYKTRNSVDSTFSSTDGTYRISLPRGGCVYLYCTKEGYTPQIFGKTFKSGEEVNYNIKLNMISEEVNP